MCIRMISRLMSFLWTVVWGGLPLSPSPSLCLSLPVPGGCSKGHAPQPYVQLYLLHPPSAQPTDSTDGTAVERERVTVSGPISEDAVWESGKEEER